jgi:hypothetical protein
MEVKQSEVTQAKSKSTLAASVLNEQSKSDLLRGLYVDLQYSAEDIGMILAMHPGTVVHYLKKYGVSRRTRGEALSLAFKKGKIKRHYAKGEGHFNWRGGRTVKSDGHILINKPEHLRANKKGYVLEHILIWEQSHGMPLPTGWAVHHLNGIPGDNRPENLKALPDLKHKRVLAAKAQRIRELESKLLKAHVEIESLRRAMAQGQLVFQFDRHQ